jgi:hypothetical protein
MQDTEARPGMQVAVSYQLSAISGQLSAKPQRYFGHRKYFLLLKRKKNLDVAMVLIADS